MKIMEMKLGNHPSTDSVFLKDKWGTIQVVLQYDLEEIKELITQELAQEAKGEEE